MRLDGRLAGQLRPVQITPKFSTYAEGSVLFAIGETQVLCNLTIENTVPRWMQIQNKPGGWVTAEYAMLPRATIQRKPRETDGLSGRTQEIRRLIGRCLRAAINLELLGQRTCILDCDVLQADGGTRTAAITGGYVALVIGLRNLVKNKAIPEEIFRPAVAAISTGIINGSPVLDLCYAEDSQAEVDANVVMNADGEFIEIQSSAEGNPYNRHDFDQLLNLAYQGIGELLILQQNIINAYS